MHVVAHVPDYLVCDTTLPFDLFLTVEYGVTSNANSQHDVVHTYKSLIPRVQLP